ncbi:hypothetical protein OH799_31450 [Nocardia sp. NBC_00881]|uniref:hypothetical protein n=1 Tax=Nocardia sp. NBC_00881 TaxID=2975995 RepID=UPI0038643892|nr:hypothetical protein OH799_31450 [Nocardia sp. NBC_00881]
MALNISPEHLPIICAELLATEVTLTSVIADWAVHAVPLPPAIDDTSFANVATVAKHSVECGRETVPGLEKLSHGAETLIPVSASYEGMDTAGGTTVGCQTSNFAR